MSKILALDSSTDACSVALHLDGDITHIFELAVKTHTQRLLPMVDKVLQRSGCRLQDLDAIAFGRGPGSFTGLRICMGVVQGLAFGANLPVIPISTLQAIAYGFMQENPSNTLPILVALDARMDEVYWSLFNVDKTFDADLQSVTQEQVMKPVMVLEQDIVSSLAHKFVALGSGWRYPELKILEPEYTLAEVYPDAKDILALALNEFGSGNQISILEAEPTYLRDTLSWQKRQRIRQI
jgi:tRNA threonylcarbamoyladenosine biosynthesis protein TsaB